MRPATVVSAESAPEAWPDGGVTVNGTAFSSPLVARSNSTSAGETWNPAGALRRTAPETFGAPATSVTRTVFAAPLPNA